MHIQYIIHLYGEPSETTTECWPAIQQYTQCSITRYKSHNKGLNSSSSFTVVQLHNNFASVFALHWTAYYYSELAYGKPTLKRWCHFNLLYNQIHLKSAHCGPLKLRKVSQFIFMITYVNFNGQWQRAHEMNSNKIYFQQLPNKYACHIDGWLPSKVKFTEYLYVVNSYSSSYNHHWITYVNRPPHHHDHY